MDAQTEEVIIYSDPNLVVVSRYVAAASYTLLLQEQRLIYMLIAKINKDDEDFKPYRFSNKEMTSIMRGKKNSFGEIAKYARKLLKRELRINRDAEGSVLYTNWLSSAEVFKDKKEIELCFDAKLKPYLLQLKEKIVKTQLDLLVRFESIYAARFYEILAGIAVRKVGDKTIGLKNGKKFMIEYIREIFEIPATYYPASGSIKARIVIPAVTEINEISDLWVEVEEIKDSRKLVGWIIKAREKTPEEMAKMYEDMDFKNKVRLIEAPENVPEDQADPDTTAADIEKREKLKAVIDMYENSPRFKGFINEVEAVKILNAAMWDLEMVKKAFTPLLDVTDIKKAPMGLHINFIKHPPILKKVPPKVLAGESNKRQYTQEQLDEINKAKDKTPEELEADKILEERRKAAQKIRMQRIKAGEDAAILVKMSDDELLNGSAAAAEIKETQEQLAISEDQMFLYIMKHKGGHRQAAAYIAEHKDNTKKAYTILYDKINNTPSDWEQLKVDPSGRVGAERIKGSVNAPPQD